MKNILLLQAGLVLSALLASSAVSLAAEPLVDAPVNWFDDDQRHVTVAPAEREPNLYWDYLNESVSRPLGRYTRPNRIVRRVGTLFGGDHVKAAANVNSLDEAVNSSWFTNRIGMFPIPMEEVRRGPGQGVGPDRSGTWTVVGAKTEGVTPGFTIEDARGGRYLIKFDPPEHEGMVTAAGVVSQRILHLAGYNVPDDNIVYFDRSDLTLGEGVRMSEPNGTKRNMTEADIDHILGSVARKGEQWRAISSSFLSGKPIGPFDYKGRRKDDPNDHIKHEERREIRGLEVFAAWLNHFDTKQHNSLDMFVEDDGKSYVRHYLIDFASTLGAGASGPSQRFGWEHTFDPAAVVRRTANLGFWDDDWRQQQRPDFDEVGYFESEQFSPRGFSPHYPNPGFSEITDRDGYWGAKIVSAFTNEQLEAIVEQAQYQEPEAAAYMVRTLGERRDKIARAWFDQIPPLDFFTHANGTLLYHDLGQERNLYPGTTARYRTRMSFVNENRGALDWSDWNESTRTEVAVPSSGDAAESHPFLAVECQVDRGSGWSSSVTAYVARGSGRVVAMKRK